MVVVWAVVAVVALLLVDGVLQRWVPATAGATRRRRGRERIARLATAALVLLTLAAGVLALLMVSREDRTDAVVFGAAALALLVTVVRRLRAARR